MCEDFISHIITTVLSGYRRNFLSFWLCVKNRRKKNFGVKFFVLASFLRQRAARDILAIIKYTRTLLTHSWFRDHSLPFYFLLLFCAHRLFLFFSFFLTCIIIKEWILEMKKTKRKKLNICGEMWAMRWTFLKSMRKLLANLISLDNLFFNYFYACSFLCIQITLEKLFDMA